MTNEKKFTKEEIERFIKICEVEGFRYVGNNPEWKEFMEKHGKNLQTPQEYKSRMNMAIPNGTFINYFAQKN